MVQNSKKLVLETFSSITEFVNVTQSRENRAGAGAESHKRGSEAAAFTRTSNYSNAMDLLLYGDKNTYQKMVNIDVKQVQSNIYKSKIRRNVAGFSPCVPAFVAGLPNAMYQVQKIKPPARRMEIIYSPTGSESVSADSLQRAGVIVLSIVNAMERRGISTALTILNKCSQQRHNKLYTICGITIKKAGQPLDGLKVAFPIAHPSFFRRFGFEWYETCPDIIGPDFYSYGTTISDCDIIKQLLQSEGKLPKESKVINFYKIEELEFNMQAVLKYLEIDLD